MVSILFFLGEKCFSKDFGVGGQAFFPLRKIYVRNLVQEGQQVVLSVCCLDQSEM
jgi:hypothetical protein